MILLWDGKLVSVVSSWKRRYKGVSCLALTLPWGNGIDGAPGGTGTDGTAGGVCSSLSSRHHDRGRHCSSLYNEQMGTKEVAVCWNYRGPLIDNLPGWRNWRQGWRRTGTSIIYEKQHRHRSEFIFWSVCEHLDCHQNSIFNQWKNIFKSVQSCYCCIQTDNYHEVCHAQLPLCCWFS